jgi:hypothetical protein
MKKLLAISSIFLTGSLMAQLNVEFSGAKGSYTFSKAFKTIKDIPRFSEWDSLPNGKWVQLYEGGQLAMEYSMKKYLLNGPAKGYYPDGKIRYEFTMKGNYIDVSSRSIIPMESFGDCSIISKVSLTAPGIYIMKTELKRPKDIIKRIEK